MKIKRDFLGLHAFAGGYSARPKGNSSFEEGDEVTARHHGGSTDVSVYTDITKDREHWKAHMGSYEYKTFRKHLTNDEFEKIVRKDVEGWKNHTELRLLFEVTKLARILHQFDTNPTSHMCIDQNKDQVIADIKLKISEL